MSLHLEEIVERLGEPETPVIWLDPSTPEEIWAGLPAALKAAGYEVSELDFGPPIQNRRTLVERLASLTMHPGGAPFRPRQVREALLALPVTDGPGWVLLYRYPSPLRQLDEGSFEEFLDQLEAVHEMRIAGGQGALKLVVCD